LTEVHAKLLGLLIQHWLWLLSCWPPPSLSMLKAAQTVQKFAWSLSAELSGTPTLQLTVHQIHRTLAAGCRTNTRCQAPATCRTLLQCACPSASSLA
jgi:hypothetical protein